MRCRELGLVRMELKVATRRQALIKKNGYGLFEFIEQVALDHIPICPRETGIFPVAVIGSKYDNG
jgi:hypothetical protein